MGIPSYFSYIVKNHRNIINKIKKTDKIDNLYLDSNSIIYDCLRKIQNEYNNENLKFEKRLIDEVCLKIEDYINIIKPKNNVLIAFDGVAPVAKLEQQRNRRYKSLLENEIFKSCGLNSSENIWNKTAITPGTLFMKNLNIGVKKYFNSKKIIVSGSDIPGEGEHKIFEYIRNNKDEHKHQKTLIYGLDADLIMLCLNHLHISKNIFLYRETPEFIKYIDSSLDPNSDYIFNIDLLSYHIIEEMGGKNRQNKTNYMYDYILLCFFLGNDFLPHFPALNIRTSGIHRLLAGYKLVMKKNTFLTDGNNINWKYLKELIEYLSKNELEYIKEEYKIRNKYERREFSSATPDEKKDKYLNIPIKNRDVEKYIDPYSYFWENRYYEKLFNIDITNDWRKKISLNYMEGLEWTMKYYSSGCSDWRWIYKYNYPPLLIDLVKYLPSWDMNLIDKKPHNPVTENLQLSYVLPSEYHYLLDQKYQNKIHNLSYFKQKNYNMEWSFCRYIWECHLILPEIDIEELEEILDS